MQNFCLLMCGLQIKIIDHLGLEQNDIKMRYSVQPKCRKYVQGHGFLSFAKKFGDKYGKKLMDTAKDWNRFCKN